MGKSAGRAPDPYQTATQQMGMNAQAAEMQARMNRPNTTGPFGTTRINRVADPLAFDESAYLAANPDVRDFIAANGGTARQHFDRFGRAEGRSGGGFREEVVTEFDPEIQRGLTQLFTRVGDRLSQDVDTSGFAPWQTRVDTSRFGAPDIQRERVEQALLSRLEPQFARDREALEGRLIAQGFTPGNEGYNRATDELARARNDARMQAVLAGGQEQSRLFGLGLQDAGFTNATRQGQVAEALQLRNTPFQEMALLFGLQPQQAQVAQVGVAAPNFQQLVSDNYAQRVAQVNAANQATAQLVGQLIGAGAQVATGGLGGPRPTGR